MEKQEKDKRNSPVFFSAEMSPKHFVDESKHKNHHNLAMV
jgi:hypothetical protein